MDLYAASRDDLIRLVLQQRDVIVDFEQRVTHQQAQTATAQATIRQLTAQIGSLTQQVATLAQQLAALTPDGAPPPIAGPPPDPAPPRGMPGLKPGRPTAPRPTKSRRRRPHGFARRRMPPTDRQVHAIAACPRCRVPLTGGTVVHTREVIELPAVPVTVTEHVYLARRCPCCQQTHRPGVDLTGVVVGQQRLGVRLVSLIATLREVGRLPILVIRDLLAAVHGVTLSAGGIVAALGQVAERATPLVAEILADLRRRAVVHGDESGWCEDGRNGYIWSFSSAWERYFEHGTRQKEHVDRVLGPDFGGVLVVDFYAAYDHYPGVKQRCWAHLLRDVDEVVRQQPKNATVVGWAVAVRALYRRASGACARDPTERRRQQRDDEQELLALCQPYLADEAAPQAVLCRRVEKYLSELFVFVGDPQVPPTNNAAERSLRPTVTARKISGGTRSVAGTATKMTLATIFGTWRVRGLNPFAECLRLLSTAPPAQAAQV